MKPRPKKAIKRALIARDGERCHYCSNKMRFDGLNFGLSATIEHLKPRAQGGSDDIRNLVLACQSCNEVRAYIQNNAIPKYVKAK